MTSKRRGVRKPVEEAAERWRFRSAGEIAQAEKVTRSFVNRLLRLTLLAPDIIEAILEGRRPKGLVLEELIRAMPKLGRNNNIA